MPDEREIENKQDCSDHKGTSLALAFRPNDVAGDEERGETGGHKNPECEHLPIQTVGLVAAQIARAFSVGVHLSNFILHSLLARVAASRPAFPIRRRAICRAR